MKKTLCLISIALVSMAGGIFADHKLKIGEKVEKAVEKYSQKKEENSDEKDSDSKEEKATEKA